MVDNDRHWADHWGLYARVMGIGIGMYVVDTTGNQGSAKLEWAVSFARDFWLLSNRSGSVV